MSRLFLFFFLLFTSVITSAQHYENDELVYGNEWIDYDQEYVKIKVAEDGIYRVDYSTLQSWGLPVDTRPMSDLQLWVYGTETPIYTTTDGLATEDDYLLFYGQRNRSQVDRFVHETDSLIFNPEYSLITDTTAYFLTLKTGTNKRFTGITAQPNDTVAKAEYIMAESYNVFTDFFHKPYINSTNVNFSSFLPGEGFGDRKRANTQFTINLPQYYADGPAKEATVRMALNYAFNHNLTVEYNGTEFLNTSAYSGLATVEHTASVEDNQSKVTFEINSTEDLDRHAVSYGKVRYARELSMDNTTYLEFEVDATSEDIALEFADLSEDVVLFNLTRQEFITLYEVATGGSGFIHQASSATERYILSYTTEVKQVETGEMKSFDAYFERNGDYIIITHPSFSQGSNVMQDYMDYRSSTAGGGYNPILIDVKDLYDQFAYGIDGHFAGIKQFGVFINNHWDDVKMVYLVGKAIQYSGYRTAAQKATGKSLVSTFGSPGADLPLFTNFGETVPYFPLGRLAANNVEEIELYLEKLKEHDLARNAGQTIADRYWMKEVLHMSGGSANDYKVVSNYLKAMKEILDTTMVGAEVTTVNKYSDETISESFTNITLDQINSGVNILTFFGHASVSTTDFRLANPSAWDNHGRYPLILSYGCYSGNCHTDGFAISEDYVFQDGKGGIAFLGTSGVAYGSDQATFGRRLYYNYGTEFYGKTLGETMYRSIQDLDGATSAGRISFLQQLVFHGDPAIVLPFSEAMDLTWAYDQTALEPANPNALDEKTTLCTDLLNLGKYLGPDSTEVVVRHYDASNAIMLDTTYRVAVPAARSRVCFDIPLKNEDLVGKNRVELSVNPQNSPIEGPSPAAQSNNMLVSPGGVTGYEFNVLSDAAIATYPYNYGIVNETEVALIATTYNAFADSASYIMELDTTPLFNSPYLQQNRLESRSPIKWTVNLMQDPERVYYWRVAPDTLGGAVNSTPAWDESSFTYIPGDAQGWNQGHWGQFDDGELESLDYDGPNLRLGDKFLDIQVVSGLNQRPAFFINGARWDNWQYNINQGVAVIVFDPYHPGNCWQNFHGTGGLYGSVNKNMSSSGWTHYFEYPASTPEEMDLLMNFLENVIPDGYTYAVAFVKRANRPNYPLDFWISEYNNGRGILKFLEEQGSVVFQQIIETGPQSLLFIAEKDKGFIFEDVSNNYETQIDHTFTYKAVADNGTLTTDIIGPSTMYRSLEWKPSAENNESDSTKFSIFTIDQQGNKSLFQILDSEDRTVNLSNITASEFPYLQLQYYVEDAPEGTPIAPRQFTVDFDAAPELILETQSSFIPNLYQGEDLEVKLNIINVGVTDANGIFDFSYNLNSTEQENSFSIDGIKSKAQKEVKIQLFTDSLRTENTLNLEVNSQRNLSEYLYSNNVGITNFKVNKDVIEPTLDITFDGRTIQANEIVSANPNIQIFINDENPYLPLPDIDAYVLSLEYPNGEVEEIDNNGELITYEIDEAGNELQVSYQPTLETGFYTLSVKAKDASNNETPETSIDFRVVKEEMISNVYNYPNPFSTSTQFIFTLTGSELPTGMVISIYTVTGKLVREITSAELGDIHIGTNRTSFKWNGTDEYGNKLANGVYLYKVHTENSAGKQYERFDLSVSDESKFFKNGFGKMVILR